MRIVSQDTRQPRPENAVARLPNADGSAFRAAEKVRDGDENHGTQGGGRKRVQKAPAENSQFGENPAAKEGSDQPQNNVRDATEAAAARNFPGEPTGNQAKEKPGDEAVRFEPDSDCPLCRHLCGEHEASFGNKDCI